MGATEALLGAAILSLIEIFTGLKTWIITNLSTQVGKIKALDAINNANFFKFLVEFTFYMSLYGISMINSSGY